MALASFKQHRTWEDGVGIALGIAIGLTPWMTGHAASRAVVLNAVLIGLSVLILAQFELVSLARWQEVAMAAGGLWLATSPFVLDYGGQGPLGTWHVTLGGLVALLGALELWQDWRLSDQELDAHGRPGRPADRAS